MTILWRGPMPSGSSLLHLLETFGSYRSTPTKSPSGSPSSSGPESLGLSLARKRSSDGFFSNRERRCDMTPTRRRESRPTAERPERLNWWICMRDHAAPEQASGTGSKVQASPTSPASLALTGGETAIKARGVFPAHGHAPASSRRTTLEQPVFFPGHVAVGSNANSITQLRQNRCTFMLMSA